MYFVRSARLLGGHNVYAYAPNPIEWVDPRGVSGEKGSKSTADGKGSKAGASPQKKPCPGNPCEGKNPAAEARSFQGQKRDQSYNPYDGVDSYTNVVIKKGTVLYALEPGGLGYGVTIATVNQSKGSAQKYHDLVQVTPGWNWSEGKPRDMRTKVKGFILQKDLCVAKGKAQANSNFIFKDDDGNTVWKDPHTYSGGGTQFYVEEAERKNFKEGKVRKI